VISTPALYLENPGIELLPQMDCHDIFFIFFSIHPSRWWECTLK